MRSLIISLFAIMGLAAQGILPASANAIWVDYQVAVSPTKQSTVVSAFNTYKTTQTGRAFPGVMFLNAQVANGANPATHNLAVVYNDQKEWETRSASIASSPDFLNFRQRWHHRVRLLQKPYTSMLSASGKMPKTVTVYRICGECTQCSALCRAYASLSRRAGLAGEWQD